MKKCLKSTHITAVALCSLLLYNQSLHSFFNDQDAQNFIDRMRKMEQDMHDFMNSVHHNIFDNITIPLQNAQKSTTVDHRTATNNAIQFFQESSNSLSFANHEKRISLTNQKNQDRATYTIAVTDAQEHADSNQEEDTVQALHNLQTYIADNFHSRPAHTILQECMNLIEHPKKNHTLNIETSHKNNCTTYIIQSAAEQTIDQDEDTKDIKAEEMIEKNSRKKRKPQAPWQSKQA
jgi:hypothetical protein